MSRSLGSFFTEDGSLMAEDENEGGRRDEVLVGSVEGSGHGGKEFLSVEEMLVRHVGEFGRAQFWHFALVSLAWVLDSLHTMVMIFADRVPEWRCLPHTGMGGALDSCSESSLLCELPREAWEWVGGRSQTTVSEWNLICGDEYKVGLAGSLFFIGNLLGAGIYGNLSDSVLGRKGSLAMSCLGAVFGGLLTSLSPSYWVYAALRFFTGLNCAGVGISSFILATEIVGPSKRGPVGMSTFYFFSSGIMILPLIAYLSPSWRYLYVGSAMPGFAYCTLVLPFLWESPRWYFVKGRLDDAMRVLRAFAKRNGRVVPDNVYLQLDGEDEEDVMKDETWKVPLPESVSLIDADCETKSPVRLEEGLKVAGGANGKKLRTKAEGTLLDVFRYGPTRCRMLLMICIWLFTAIVYYGISLNVVNLGVNLYISVFINGLIEWPALAITASLLGRLGRRTMLAGSMALSGICCLLGSLIFLLQPPEVPTIKMNLSVSDFSRLPNSNLSLLQQVHSPQSGLNMIGTGFDFIGVLRLACGVVGLFGMAGTYNLIFIYTIELFPTEVRNAALGLASQAGGIGAVTAPLIVVFGHSIAFLPFLIFGFLALAGSGLAIRLPETNKQHLHETMYGMKRKASLVDKTEAELPTPLVQGESNIIT